jgi:serine protease Do
MAESRSGTPSLPGEVSSGDVIFGADRGRRVKRRNAELVRTRLSRYDPHRQIVHCRVMMRQRKRSAGEDRSSVILGLIRAPGRTVLPICLSRGEQVNILDDIAFMNACRMNSCCVALPVPCPHSPLPHRNPPTLMLHAVRHLTVLVVSLLLGACTADARGAGDSFAPLVHKVLPSVVNIQVTELTASRDLLRQLPPELRDTPLGREFRRRFGSGGQEHAIGAGSGFIIDPSGIIVTNNHVVGHAEKIIVALTNGHQYPAKLIGQDQLTDIAVIKVVTNEPLAAVTWGDSRQMQVGDWVLSAGNPFGLGGSVTAGIVSAEGRDLGSGPFDDFLQLDAPINPGNSGGPVFNMAGQVIGVSSVIVSPTGASVGIGFAIPSEIVNPVVRQLIATGTMSRGWLGVSVEDRQTGVLIAAIDRAGPASRAGLRPGDQVVSINGTAVSTSRGLIRAVAAQAPGENAHLIVRREGQTMDVPVTIGLRPSTRAERPEQK